MSIETDFIHERVNKIIKAVDAGGRATVALKEGIDGLWDAVNAIGENMAKTLKVAVDRLLRHAESTDKRLARLERITPCPECGLVLDSAGTMTGGCVCDIESKLYELAASIKAPDDFVDRVMESAEKLENGKDR
jgi:hypothetical protein